MAKHKHAEVIKAWADGATIQHRWRESNWETVTAIPKWDNECEYRIKPEHIYPETKMSETELCLTFKGKGLHYGLRDIANAAIRHAIDSGQVVIPDTKNYVDQLDFVVAHDPRAVRDMAIAEAVREKCVQVICGNSSESSLQSINIYAIIATVK